jgi:magnesium transporter
LRETFGFHILAVEDALQETHAPKIDDWGDYLYIVLHAIESNKQDSRQMYTPELDVFLGGNYIVTYHDHPIPIVDRVWVNCQRDERRLKQGADHIKSRIY